MTNLSEITLAVRRIENKSNTFKIELIRIEDNNNSYSIYAVKLNNNIVDYFNDEVDAYNIFVGLSKALS